MKFKTVKRNIKFVKDLACRSNFPAVPVGNGLTEIFWFRRHEKWQLELVSSPSGLHLDSGTSLEHSS